VSSVRAKDTADHTIDPSAHSEVSAACSEASADNSKDREVNVEALSGQT